MKKIMAIILLLSSTMAVAEVYKWVDENGVTHYGSKKPPVVEAEVIKVNSGSGTKAVDSDTQEFAEGAKKELMKDYGASATLDCNKSVANSREQLNDMTLNLDKNFRGGFVSDSGYRATKAKLEKAMRKISASDCGSSSGENRNFYLCMANSRNSVMMCGAKHNLQ
jgi:hypothetical protein